MKPVSKTAYYCCGIRMQDAASANPLIGDKYARILLGEEGMEYWKEFRRFEKPNASNLARHYIIDNHLKKILQEQPDSTIILIGAGFDSRAYRFDSGKWIEVDEPAIIDYKNQRLPVRDCKNALDRISISFENEDLTAKLHRFARLENVVIVVEGVLLYLTYMQKNELLKSLTTLFPRHLLFCDLMTRKFFNKFSKGIHEKLTMLGSTFSDLTDHPDKIFLDYGYKENEVTSTVKTANDLGLIYIPKFVASFLFGKILTGYSVYSFSYA